MTINKICLTVGAMLAAVSFAGCMSTPPPIAFNYQVDNGKANGIVQVFDLSGNTVVQIRNIDPKATRFFNTNNVEIPYKVVGENVVLNGLQTSFTVSSARAASRVVRVTPLSTEPARVLPAHATLGHAAPADGAAPSTSRQTNEAVLAEIVRIKKELAELKKLFAAAEQPATNVQPSAAVVAAALEDKANVVRVSFANNSLNFAPSRQAQAQIIELAKSANAVEVRGFTDSSQPSATSEALAKGRAAAAKRFLIRHGVDGKKVRVEYEPAGKFVTENITSEGKSANRRVEIRAS